MTILRKGLILIAVPLLFQLGFIALTARLRVENARAVDWAIHTKDVLALSEACRVGLLSAHGAIQGYILTRDTAFADDLARREAASLAKLGELRGLVKDNQDQSRAAGLLAARGRDFLAYMKEGADLVRAGRLDLTSAARRRGVSQGKLDALERDFETFNREERNLDEMRRVRLDENRALIDRMLGVGVAVSVGCTLIMAVLFARNISGRIARLTENSRRLAERRELVPAIGGGDEVARLDAVFHEMARTLSEGAARERVHADLLERRAEELAVVNAQLSEKARENEMFVYSVSHDLRSPLVNLQGFSKELGMIGKDLARLVDAEGVPPEVRRKARGLIEADMGESIGFIQVAVSRLSAIIDALLRLSRAGRVEYRRQEVAVGPIVARVVSALRGTIDERGATVTVGDLPPALGDPTAIEQVFANLVGNAINYLDPARPGRIEVVAAGHPEGPAEPHQAGRVVYAVVDNGLGIPEAYKGKVFTAFQRLHGDVAKGEGIGLALVRRVVERLGGRIWFESEAGRGTTFFVSLPGVEDDEATEAAAGAGGNGREVACQSSR